MYLSVDILTFNWACPRGIHTHTCMVMFGDILYERWEMNLPSYTVLVMSLPTEMDETGIQNILNVN